MSLKNIDDVSKYPPRLDKMKVWIVLQSMLKCLVPPLPYHLMWQAGQDFDHGGQHFIWQVLRADPGSKGDQDDPRGARGLHDLIELLGQSPEIPYSFYERSFTDFLILLTLADDNG